MAISFEGSVADIQELAMKKALRNTPTGFTCPGAEIQTMEIATWKYSIEYEDGSDPSEIIAELELALQGSLSPRILACQNSDVEDEAIIAIDSGPIDLPDPNGKSFRHS